MVKNILKGGAILFAIVIMASATRAITITVSPVTVQFTAILPTPFGTDMPDPSGILTIDVGNCVAGENWKISAHKTNANNPAGFQTVAVKRTGTGSGTGSPPSGGDISYLFLQEGVDQQFFTGNYNRTDIPISWIISNLTVMIEPSYMTYGMIMYFSVTSI